MTHCGVLISTPPLTKAPLNSQNINSVVRLLLMVGTAITVALTCTISLAGMLWPNGSPLTIFLIATNIAHNRMLEEMINAILPIRQRVGRPEITQSSFVPVRATTMGAAQNPKQALGSDRIAFKGIKTSHRLGRHQGFVEHTIAWFFTSAASQTAATVADSCKAFSNPCRLIHHAAFQMEMGCQALFPARG